MTMSTVALIIAIIDVLVCIALVGLVIFQEGNDKGLGVIGGGADTFYGKDKGRTFESRLKKITAFLAIGFAALTILLFRILAGGV